MIPEHILQKLFRDIIDRKSPAIIIVKDGIINWVNEGVVDITGYTVEELLGMDRKTVRDTFIPELGGFDGSGRFDNAQYEGELQDPGKGIISSIKTSNGDLKWCQFVLNPVQTEDGQYMVALFVDITKLKESDEKFRLLTNESLFGIAVIQEGLVKYANKELTQILETNHDELNTMAPYELLKLVHHDDKGIARNFLESINNKNRDISPKRVRFETSQGKIKWVNICLKNTSFEGKHAILVLMINITEHIEDEQKLAESEERFKSISEQSMMGIVIIQNKKIIYANEKIVEILGFSREKMMEWTLDEMMAIVKPERRDELLARHEKHVKGNDTKSESSYTLEISTVNGNKKFLNIFTKSININGAYANLILAMDVTQNKISEMKLVESEEKFKAIAENSNIGIILLDIGINEIFYINEQASNIYGYSMNQMYNWTGTHLLMKIHPDETLEFKEKLAAFLRDKNDVHGNAFYRIFSKDGTVKWLDSFISKISFQSNPALLLMFADKTPEKVAEQKIIESEQKYRELFEKSTASIILMDKHGTIIDCNPAAEDLFFIKKNMLVGINLKQIRQYFSVSEQFINNVLSDLKRGREIIPFDARVKTGRNNKDRGWIWITIRASKVKFGKQYINQLIIHDITANKNLENMLERENIKLKELDAMRKNFISTATHELKTPLVSIYSATEFLATSLREELGENAVKLIDIVYRGAKRLKESIDDILQVSRMERGNFSITFNQFDIVQLVQNVLRQEEYLINMSEHEIIINIPETLEVIADKDKVEQVITNLLTNAIKNTPPGGKIDVFMDKSGDDTITFSITDTGVGLTKEELEQLFTQFGKFNRTDLNSPVNIQGTGLGLFISKNIIDKHGGTIWAESEGRNQGSTFNFTIPRTQYFKKIMIL
ncbi:MAG: PAS domain S-box protein [Promethearchaeota archaeon]